MPDLTDTLIYAPIDGTAYAPRTPTAFTLDTSTAAIDLTPAGIVQSGQGAGFWIRVVTSGAGARLVFGAANVRDATTTDDLVPVGVPTFYYVPAGVTAFKANGVAAGLIHWRRVSK